MRLKVAFALLGLLQLLGSVHSRFIVEQGGIKVKFPADARKKYAKGFDSSLANFGSPRYGGSIVGTLVYPHKDYGEDFECKPIPCNWGCEPFSEARPPFALDKKTPYIMLIDRGPEQHGMKPCKFAEKVWNAQLAGAIGAIIMNYDDRPTTMEAPNDEDDSLTFLRNITIPAALISKSDGEALLSLIKPTRSEAHPRVMVSMDWTDILPRSEIVHWEFWSNANDMCGPVCDVQKDFMKEFAPVAQDFQKNKWVEFTPHYLVWVCPDSYHRSDECKSQCIRQGRYCTPDPDGDLAAGYSGADVVQENLRQLCVFRLANDSGKPWVWWDYVTRFGAECSMEEKKYNQDCAEKIFKEIGGEEWSNMGALRHCMGDINEDKPSSILDAEMSGQRGDDKEGEVYILPTIRINEGQYRGKLSYTEVLRALCAGFNKNDEPAACNKVGENDCRVGAPGEVDCKGRKDGKTVCKDTFAGYVCTCGSGFISHIDPKNGTEVCLDINECLTTDLSVLEPACTCERCACKNVYGGYECIENLADECKANNGGCWQADHYIGLKKHHFSACKDNIKAVKDAAAHGKDVEKLPLHTCECPKCFKQGKDYRGHVTCTPACDLAECDLTTGACAGGGSGGSGTPAWSVLLSVLAAVAIITAAGYGLYRFRLRHAMHQEVRAIMAQYMPLQETEERPSANDPFSSDQGGDPNVQDSLVDMLKVQIGQQYVKEYFDEESEKLKQKAEEAKAEIDKLNQLELDRSTLAFGSAMADINQSADEFEQKLLEQRRQNEADEATFVAWQQQMARDRSAGHFFKSLYQTDAQLPDDHPLRFADKKPAEPAAAPEQPPAAPSTFQLLTCSFLAGVLAMAVAADLSTHEPHLAQDALYVALCAGLAAGAWSQRSAL